MREIVFNTSWQHYLDNVPRVLTNTKVVINITGWTEEQWWYRGKELDVALDYFKEGKRQNIFTGEWELMNLDDMDLDEFFLYIYRCKELSDDLRKMACRGRHATNIKQKQSVAFFFSMLPATSLHHTWADRAKELADGCYTLSHMMRIGLTPQRTTTKVIGSATIN